MSRELLQQALDALEALQGGCTDSNDGTVEAITVWCPELIDAIRAHLAQPPATSADYAMGYAEGFNDACKPAQPAPVPKLIRTFNAGYMLGHHDTVEGVFTDIHSSDMDTYHADEVAEFFGQSAAPAAKCDGGTCGAGGYCANCPKQAAAPVPVPLTADDIWLLWTRSCEKPQLTRGLVCDFARAIERAHGIAASPEVP
jgi:hypothetical protein